MSRFEHCLNVVLHHEGGFVNHPRDPGGMTNMGITRHTLEGWLGKSVDEAYMKGLKPEDVKPIYEARYWNVIRASQMPPGIDLAVFDFAVNAGPRASVRLLQRVIGVSADGLVGPITLGAVKQFVAQSGAKPIIREHCELRREYYRSLDTFDVFGRGWLSRTDKIEKQACDDAK